MFKIGLTDPDEIIERLTQRYARQLNLRDILTEEDLRNQLESALEGGSDYIQVKMSGGWRTITKDDAKDNITGNVGTLFETSKIELRVINNISNLTDLGEIQDVIDTGSPTFRLEAREIGRQVSRNNVESGSMGDVEDGVDFLKRYNPQSLGQLKTTLKRRGYRAFREIFGEE